MSGILNRAAIGFRGLLATSLFVVLLGAPSEVWSQSATDAKVWAGFVGRVEISKPLKIDVEHQQRFSSSDGAEKNLTEIKGRFRAHKFVRLAAAYRLIAAGDPDGVHHRLSVDGGTRVGMGKVGLSYRLRYQSTIRPNETLSTLRNKVGLGYELGKGLAAEVATELHYSLGNSEFRELRVVGGVDKKISKRLKIGGFYMFQNEFNKKTTEYNHILGVGLTYVFRRYDRGKSRGVASEAAEESAEDTSKALDL